MGEWISPTPSELDEIEFYQSIAERAAAEAEAERREQSRLVFHTEVTVKSATNFFMGFAENLSEGGIFLSTMSPPLVGEHITLFVKLADGTEVEIEGVVRWHRFIGPTIVTGCGVQFLELDARVKAMFEQTMLALQKEPLFFEV